MKIAIIGATGMVGSKVLSEALRRGHEVTAIVRHPEKLKPHDKLRPMKSDIKDEQSMVSALSGHDAVISSVHFSDFDGPTLLGEVKKSGVDRYLVVGGAGSLEVMPGVQAVDTPDFPQEYKSEALKGREYLDLLQKEDVLNWTYLSPQMQLVPGERTGKFRIGTNQMLVNNDGQSTISVEDLAFALIDELERPMFSRQRFTVGY